ncbi:hypothetical protein HD554DRAFT_1990364, partial [Boletus coccyginus]
RIEYMIFDMDGLLIDTKSLYTQGTNDILTPYRVQMTSEIKAGLMGKGMPSSIEQEAAAHLLAFFPGTALAKEDYITQHTISQDHCWSTVHPLSGVPKLISHLMKHKIPIMVATSLKCWNFSLKLAHL